MVEVKKMPYREKYANVIGNMKMYETFIPPFLQKHLGNEAVVQLQNIWQEGLKQITEDASDEDKYETAYANWIWMAKSNLDFIHKQLGEEENKQFELVEIEAFLKSKNSGLALFLLKLIRAISPDTAFTMTNKKMAYELQWITPFSVSEMTRDRAIFDIPQCKILDFPDVNGICTIGCQSIYPRWMAEQLMVDMKFNRQGNSCTATVTPLR
ncbi:hypothetical protein ACFLVI_02605 [Chloroflexota bacterium]